MIPLSIDAEPSGEPFELGDDEPLPSPIVGPHVTRDGSTETTRAPVNSARTPQPLAGTIVFALTCASFRPPATGAGLALRCGRWGARRG